MINIDDKTRRLSQATIVVGYKQENKAESIEFEIPDYLKEYGKKICFKTKDGKVFSKLFDNTTSNIFTFTRTETQYGELYATIEFFKTENEDMVVYKTSMLHIIFNESIICEDEVQPDEPKIPILESLIEKVTDLNNTITENEEVRNNNEDTRISNENSRIANETQRDIYYTGIQNKVNNGEFNGATFTPSVDKDGNISWTNNKGLENPSSQNIRGPQGIQGPQGEAFKIKKTYSSIEAMQADFDNMEVGDYVMIVTSIELEDNAKLYSRTETEWVFITDFSGAQGIQGEQGPQGIQGIHGEKGTGISSLEVRDGSLYVTLTDNTQQNAGLIITDEVKQWIVNQVTDNAKSNFNTYYNGKIADFDEHTEQKTNEFDENAESLKAKVEELEKENKLIKEQIPGANASGNSIHVKDSGTLDFDWKIRGGHKQENREGYNLFQINFASKTVGGVTVVTNEDKSIVANGTMTAAWLNFIQYDITDKLEDSETYTIWQKNYATGVGGIYLQIRQTEIENPTKFVNYHSASKKVTFTVDKSKYKYTVFLQTAGKTETFNNYTNAYMLYKGTEDKPYEQYGVSPSPDYPSEIETVNGSVEIDVVNKNFLNISNKLDGTSIGVTTTTNNNGSIHISGTTMMAGPLFEKGRVKVGYLKAGTYSFSAKLIGSSQTTGANSCLYFRPASNGKEYATMNPYANGTVFNNRVTLASDTEVFIEWYCNKSGVSIDADLYVQIERATANTETEQHQSQTAIMPIQQEMLEGDYVADVEHHEWGKYVFTGEEDYVKSSNYSDDKYFCGYIDIGLSGLNMKQGSAAYCTHFKRFGSYGNILNEECINITTQFQVRILASHLTENSAEAFKSWLKSQYEAGTPVIIYYKLAEPLNLELTAEQKSIRDTKLYTYKNITNIDVSDELASIDVTYKKDLETEHNKLQNEIDEIKQLLSTTETSALLLDNLQKDVEMEVE